MSERIQMSDIAEEAQTPPKGLVEQPGAAKQGKVVGLVWRQASIDGSDC